MEGRQGRERVADLVAVEGRHRRLRLGEKPTDGDVVGRPRREDAESRLTERQVLIVGPAHQFPEDRVVEPLPPIDLGRRLGADLLAIGIDPLPVHLRNRTEIVGANLQSVVPILAERRAAADHHSADDDPPADPADEQETLIREPVHEGQEGWRGCARQEDLSCRAGLTPARSHPLRIVLSRPLP